MGKAPEGRSHCFIQIANANIDMIEHASLLIYSSARYTLGDQVGSGRSAPLEGSMAKQPPARVSMSQLVVQVRCVQGDSYWVFSCLSDWPYLLNACVMLFR
jgi:hypothetical protein